MKKKKKFEKIIKACQPVRKISGKGIKVQVECERYEGACKRQKKRPQNAKKNNIREQKSRSCL